MGTTDNNGIWKYDNNDSVNGWSNYMNLSTNSVSNALSSIRPKLVYTATSQTDANSKVTSLKASGLTPSTTSPFFFWRTDTKSLWTYNNTTWAEIGKANVTVSNVANTLVQTGSWTYSNSLSPNGQTGGHKFTFPIPYSSTPIVVTNSNSARVVASTKDITASSFVGNGLNVSAGSVGAPITINYIAVGVKS